MHLCPDSTTTSRQRKGLVFRKEAHCILAIKVQRPTVLSYYAPSMSQLLIDGEICIFSLGGGPLPVSSAPPIGRWNTKPRVLSSTVTQVTSFWIKRSLKGLTRTFRSLKLTLMHNFMLFQQCLHACLFLKVFHIPAEERKGVEGFGSSDSHKRLDTIMTNTGNPVFYLPLYSQLVAWRKTLWLARNSVY